jgi:Rieske Fe-S protein
VEPEHRDRPHLPAPSLYPLAFAAGIACVLVGLVVSPLFIAPIGGAIAAIFGFLWARDATMQYRRVPEHIEPERRPEPATETAPAVPAQRGEAGMPRSRFLEGATLGLGGVIGAIVSVPPLVMALGPSFGKQWKHRVDLGPLSDFPEGKWFITHFLVDPKLGDVTRRTAYIRNNGLLDGKPSFTIISNRCAHLGCPVQPNGPTLGAGTSHNEGGGQLVTLIPMLPAGGFGCPCHGGQYDQEGNRTAGPPVRSLDRYEFSVIKGNLILGKTFSVAHVYGTGKNARIKKYNLAGPGEHVDGWEQIFYPLQPPH